MKNVAVIAVLFGLVAVCLAQQDKYTTRYDGIDIDQILKSDRLFNNYYNCLMDKGKCTPDGRELKRKWFFLASFVIFWLAKKELSKLICWFCIFPGILPDALRTECRKCNENQRRGSERVLKYIIENKPVEWGHLQRKYDPENVYIHQAGRLGVRV